MTYEDSSVECGYGDWDIGVIGTRKLSATRQFNIDYAFLSHILLLLKK